MRQIPDGGSSSITPATTGARLLLGALHLRLQLGNSLVLRVDHRRELVDGRLVLAELALRLELAPQIGLAPLLIRNRVEHREADDAAGRHAASARSGVLSERIFARRTFARPGRRSCAAGTQSIASASSRTRRMAATRARCATRRCDLVTDLSELEIQQYQGMLLADQLQASA